MSMVSEIHRSSSDLRKLKDKKVPKKTKFNIVKLYAEFNQDKNLNTETINTELIAFPIIKTLQDAIKDQKFCSTLSDDEILKLVKFTDRLITIQLNGDKNEMEDEEPIEVQSLSNNQIKNTLSVQFDTKQGPPSTWYSVAHLIVHHTIIVKIPGLKNQLDKKIGELTTEQVENLLEMADEEIGSAEEVQPGFDSAKVKCSNIADRTKIFNYIRKMKPDWDTKIPPIHDPQIKLLGVKFDEDDKVQWVQRLFLKNRWKKCWKVNIKHYYRSGKSFEVIIEIDPALREWLELHDGMVSVGYRRVRAVDHFDIKQCRRCTKFGHLSNRCTQLSICPFCGDKSHIHEQCPIKEHRNKWRCPNCQKRGESAFDIQCEKFQEKLLFELEKRNFQYKMIMA